MAQLHFYATTDDVVKLIDYLFSIADLELYEAYSRSDAEIRRFSCAAEIPGSDHIQANHGGIFVRGAWTSVTRGLEVRRFELAPGVGSFRHAVEGVGAFQLVQGRPRDSLGGALDRSVFSHWNEAGARERAMAGSAAVDEVNWKEFRRISGKVHRHVRNTLAVARIPAGHVLPGAFDLLRNGGKLLGYPTLISIDSPQLLRL